MTRSQRSDVVDVPDRSCGRWRLVGRVALVVELGKRMLARRTSAAGREADHVEKVRLCKSFSKRRAACAPCAFTESQEGFVERVG